MHSLPIAFVYKRGCNSARIVVGIGDCVDNPTPLHLVGNCDLLDDEPMAESFTPSQTFESFLYDFLSRAAPRTAEVASHARELGNGTIAILDLKSAPNPSAEPDHFCTFDVEDGAVILDSFTRNMDHRLFNENGIFCLTEELYGELLEELAPLLRRKGVA